jgi:exonuclease SbcC
VIELKQLMATEEAAASGFDRQQALQLGQLEAKRAEYEGELKTLLEDVSKPKGSSKKLDHTTMLETQTTELRQSLRKLSRALGDSEGQLGAIRAQLSDIKSQQTRYREAIAGSGKCPECGQETPTAHLKSKLAELIKKQGRVTLDENVAKADVDDLAKTLSQVEIALKKIEALTLKASATIMKLDNATRDITRLEKTENHHDTQLAHLKIRRQVARDDGKRLSTELETAEELAKTYELWSKAFKEIRLSIIDSVLRELEMAVTRHVGALGLTDWRVEFQTERQTQSGSVSVAFTVLLYPPDRAEAIRFESYSGGESQRLQLAMAFGLSEVLLERAGVSPSCEILDEPTRGLSSQGIEDLLEHLSERAHELGRAIYFVDHHSLDRGAFDGVITITKDQTGSHIR